VKNQTSNTLIVMLALVSSLASSQFAPAQTFKKVSVQGAPKMAQIASGGTSVWALASNGNPYIYNGTQFVLAKTISLTQIAVGGGNLHQADTVWALDSAGNIYKAAKSGTSWVFSHIAGSLDLIAVGPGYQEKCHPYEVWGLNTSSQIYRYNFCSKSFEQEPGNLCDIHVGGGDIWGADCGPDVFRFNFATGVFDQIYTFFGFAELAVGADGGVWAIDTSSSIVWQYDSFGDGFQHTYSVGTQIQAGGDGVWVLNGQKIYRFGPPLQFVQVPGSLVSISVGTGGGVWGIDSLGNVRAFSMP
jgi:hypothetical protein